MAGRLSSDATLVKAAITDRISVVFQNSTLFLVAFVIAYILNWRMALVVTATFPLMIISALGQQAFLKGFAGEAPVSRDCIGRGRTVHAGQCAACTAATRDQNSARYHHWWWNKRK